MISFFDITNRLYVCNIINIGMKDEEILEHIFWVFCTLNSHYICSGVFNRILENYVLLLIQERGKNNSFETVSLRYDFWYVTWFLDNLVP